MIATSRYQAREKIAASGLAAIGTTVGRPRFKLGYELLWHGGGAEGDDVAEVAELIAECDREIAATSTGEQRAKNMAAVAYADRSDTFDALAELAIKTASGTVDPQARMRVGYAENAVDAASA
jgi:hypothetical protein